MAVPTPRKVLFVEDESALRTSYQRFFEGRYTMAYAPNGAEAISGRLNAVRIVKAR